MKMKIKILILISLLLFIPSIAKAASLSEVCFPSVVCGTGQDYYADACRTRINTVADCSPYNAFDCNSGCFNSTSSFCSANDKAYKTDINGNYGCYSVSDNDWSVSSGNLTSVPSGNVGIGATPNAKLTVFGNGNLGAFNSPSGVRSYAFGLLNTVALNDSVAIGVSNSNFGKTAFTTGLWNTIGCASGTDCSDTTSNPPSYNGSNNDGEFAVALGQSNLVTGKAAIALGGSNNVTGYNSFAAGYQNNVLDDMAIAIGWKNKASAETAVAIGYDTKATGYTSIAIGSGITVSGNRSVGIGLGLGSYVTLSQSDTMAIMGGKVGIGTVSPGAQLTIGTVSDYWTNSNWGKAIELPNATAIKWAGNSGSWRWGIGQTNGGFYIIKNISDGTGYAPAYPLYIDDNYNDVTITEHLNVSKEIHASSGINASSWSWMDNLQTGYINDTGTLNVIGNAVLRNTVSIPNGNLEVPNNTRESCEWSNIWISEESGRNSYVCPDGKYVAGIMCQGSYCDDRKLYCCEL